MLCKLKTKERICDYMLQRNSQPMGNDDPFLGRIYCRMNNDGLEQDENAYIFCNKLAFQALDSEAVDEGTPAFHFEVSYLPFLDQSYQSTIEAHFQDLSKKHSGTTQYQEL